MEKEPRYLPSVISQMRSCLTSEVIKNDEKAKALAEGLERCAGKIAYVAPELISGQHWQWVSGVVNANILFTQDRFSLPLWQQDIIRIFMGE